MTELMKHTSRYIIASLFALILMVAGVGEVWGADDITLTRTFSADRKTSTWSSMSVTVAANSSCLSNGLLFVGNERQISTTDNKVNTKDGSLFYVQVPSSSSIGTISILGSETKSDRTVVLKSGEKISMDKTNPQSAGFVSGDIENINGGYYIKVLSVSDFKFTQISVTLTSGEYGAYNITYNYQGHGRTDWTLEGLSSIPSELPTPTADGYTFKGWSTNNVNIVAVATGQTLSANQPIYAIWDINKGKTMPFNINSSQTSVGHVTVNSLQEPQEGMGIMLPPSYKTSQDITIPADNESNWTFGKNNQGGNVTNKGQYNKSTLREAYFNTSSAIGDVLTQTVTGLANGKYEVVLNVAASATNMRDFKNNPIPTGNNLTQAFARSGSTESAKYIPVIDRTEVGVSAPPEYDVISFVVNVSNGTLTYGLKNTEVSGNWFLCKVQSIKKIDDAGFLGWYNANLSKVGNAGENVTTSYDGITRYAYFDGGNTAANLTTITADRTFTPSAHIIQGTLVDDSHVLGHGMNAFETGKGVTVKGSNRYLAVKIPAKAILTVTGFCNGNTNQRQIYLGSTAGDGNLAKSEIIPVGETKDAVYTNKTGSDQVVYISANDQDLYVKQIQVIVPIPVTGITLNETSKKIHFNATDATKNFTLTPTVAPNEATDKSVTWTSSNTTVATVTSNGNVSATSNTGKATITATSNYDNSKKATCDVFVYRFSSMGNQNTNMKVEDGDGKTHTIIAQLPDASGAFINDLTADNFTITSNNAAVLEASFRSYDNDTRRLVLSLNVNATGTATITVACNNNVTGYENVKTNVTFTVADPKSVTYDANGSTSGSVPTDANTYSEGDEVTVLGNTGNLAKTDFLFAGWNTLDNGTGTLYVPGDKFTIGSSAVTLYAMWVQLATPTYTKADGSTSISGGTKIPVGSKIRINSTAGTSIHAYWDNSDPNPNHDANFLKDNKHEEVTSPFEIIIEKTGTWYCSAAAFLGLAASEVAETNFTIIKPSFSTTSLSQSITDYRLNFSVLQEKLKDLPWDNTACTISYKSSNPNVAQADINEFRLISPGTTSITAVLKFKNKGKDIEIETEPLTLTVTGDTKGSFALTDDYSDKSTATASTIGIVDRVYTGVDGITLTMGGIHGGKNDTPIIKDLGNSKKGITIIDTNGYTFGNIVNGEIWGTVYAFTPSVDGRLEISGYCDTRGQSVTLYDINKKPYVTSQNATSDGGEVSLTFNLEKDQTYYLIGSGGDWITFHLNKFSFIRKIYTITYNANGNGGTVPAKTENVNAIPDPLPRMETTNGYFIGWYKEDGCTNVAIPGSAINANTTLYAKSITSDISFTGGENKRTETWDITKLSGAPNEVIYGDLTVKHNGGYDKFDGKGVYFNGGESKNNRQIVYTPKTSGTITITLYTWTNIGIRNSKGQVLSLTTPLDGTRSAELKAGETYTIYPTGKLGIKTIQFESKIIEWPEAEVGAEPNEVVCPTLINPYGCTVTYSYKEIARTSGDVTWDVNTGAISSSTIGNKYRIEATASVCAASPTGNGAIAIYELTITKLRAPITFGDYPNITWKIGGGKKPTPPTLISGILSDPRTITYASSNTDIVTVDNNGKLTYKDGTGTATITATAAENAQYQGASASYTVTVSSDYKHTVTFLARDAATTGNATLTTYDLSGKLNYTTTSGTWADGRSGTGTPVVPALFLADNTKTLTISGVNPVKIQRVRITTTTRNITSSLNAQNAESKHLYPTVINYSAESEDIASFQQLEFTGINSSSIKLSGGDGGVYIARIEVDYDDVYTQSVDGTNNGYDFTFIGRGDMDKTAFSYDGAFINVEFGNHEQTASVTNKTGSDYIVNINGKVVIDRGLPSAGTYYAFSPQLNGDLTVNGYFSAGNNGAKLFKYDGRTSSVQKIKDTDTEEISFTNTDTKATATYALEKNNTYYLYVPEGDGYFCLSSLTYTLTDEGFFKNPAVRVDNTANSYYQALTGGERVIRWQVAPAGFSKFKDLSINRDGVVSFDNSRDDDGGAILVTATTESGREVSYVITVPFKGDHTWTLAATKNTPLTAYTLLTYLRQYDSERFHATLDNWMLKYEVIEGEKRKDPLAAMRNGIDMDNAKYISETAGLLFKANAGSMGFSVSLSEGGNSLVDVTNFNQVILNCVNSKIIIPDCKKDYFVKLYDDPHAGGSRASGSGAQLSFENLTDLDGKVVEGVITTTGVQPGQEDPVGCMIFRVQEDGDVTINLEGTGWNKIWRIELTKAYSTELHLRRDINDGKGNNRVDYTQPNYSYVYRTDAEGNMLDENFSMRFYGGPSVRAESAKDLEYKLFPDEYNGINFDKNVSSAEWVSDRGQHYHDALIRIIDKGIGNIKVQSNVPYTDLAGVKYILNRDETWVTVGELMVQNYPYTWDFTQYNMDAPDESDRVINKINNKITEGEYREHPYGEWSVSKDNILQFNSCAEVKADGKTMYQNADPNAENGQVIYKPLFASGAQLTYGLTPIPETMGLGIGIDAGLRTNTSQGYVINENQVRLANSNISVKGSSSVITIPGINATTEHPMYVFINSDSKPDSVKFVGAGLELKRRILLDEDNTIKRKAENIYAYKVTDKGDVIVSFPSSTEIYKIAVTDQIKDIMGYGYATESRAIDIDYNETQTFSHDVRPYKVTSVFTSPSGKDNEWTKASFAQMEGMIADDATRWVMPAGTGVVLRDETRIAEIEAIQNAAEKDKAKQSRVTYSVPLFVPAVNISGKGDYQIADMADNLLLPTTTSEQESCVIKNSPRTADEKYYTLTNRYREVDDNDKDITQGQYIYPKNPGFYRHLTENGKDVSDVKNKAYLITSHSNSKGAWGDYLMLKMGRSDDSEEGDDNGSISNSIIFTTDGIYTLQGIKVERPTPGRIYIVNGKKIMYK